ncbi:MAG: leucine-rich repeat domain-containing protein [Alistipes sp.]|nr:leucine-rich repeat domain-containing protein [Alistipes sp.]
MKRLWLWAMLCVCMAACSKSAIEETSIPVVDAPTLYAEIADESASRTYLEQAKYMRWHADDEISAFLGNTLNQRYGFDGKTGANSGTFSQVSYQLGTGNPIEEIRAFYPYAASTSFDDISGKVNYIFPKLQKYGEGDTYGQGANPMVATSSSTSDTFLYFRNICGFLKLQLYGDDVTVKAILVKGNQAEKLSGAAVITAEYNANPSVAMADEATEGVVLDCGEGVALSEDANNPTLFWIAIPPTTFKGGFTITIKGDNGKGHIQSTTKQRIITRNEYLQMPAFAVVCNKEINEEDFQENAQTEQQVVIPNNQIWYTTMSGLPYDITDNGQYNPYDMFGANIVSHASQGDKIVIVFDGDVTKISGHFETGAFGKPLKTITLPNSITEIGRAAFAGNSQMEKISIPSSVTRILGNAFRNCTSLTSITIPDGVTNINPSAFSGCSALSTFKGKFASADCRYLIDDGRLLAFAPAELSSYTIPNEVTKIGVYAFINCTLLREISIPSSVTEVQSNAFEGCASLASVTFPNSVTHIGGKVFKNCTALRSVTWPENIEQLGPNLFIGCSMLTSIEIPPIVSQVAGEQFLDCVSLMSITVLERVTAASFPPLFRGCVSMRCVNYESTTPHAYIHELPDGCKIYVPATAVESYKSAWPEYADRIVANTENPPISILAYTASEKVAPYAPTAIDATLLNNVFNEVTHEGLITFDGAITTIGELSFYSLYSLNSIDLPASVVEIGRSAFDGCKQLQQISLPERLATIGYGAFDRCRALQTIYSLSETPPLLGRHSFDSSVSNRKIYVPASDDDSIITAYKNAWSDYADEIEEYDFSAEK